MISKTTPKVASAALALAATVALAGCSANDVGGAPEPAVSASASRPDSSVSASADFNSQDVMFAQLMIPHHSQAVTMSNAIINKPGMDAETRTLARQIALAQQPEIESMTKWLQSWGQADGGMAGMDHGVDDSGMATEEEMAELTSAEPEAAQKMFLTMMVNHHNGAIEMAKTEIESGQFPAAVEMATGIVASQQEEITTMEKMRDRL